MVLVRWSRNSLADPFAEFDSLQEEMGRLFGLMNAGQAGLFDRSASPAINVLDEGEKVAVICNLPGVDRKDIESSVVNNVLSIKAELSDGVLRIRLDKKPESKPRQISVTVK